jgi:uncharacterized protein (DUF1697 family)
MSMHVALLRAVNVAGRRPVAMGALRDMCGTLGLTDVRSLLQSGNLIFRSDRSPSQLEALLSREMERCLGVSTEVFVRTGAEWKRLVAGNPFPEAAENDPGHLLLMPLRAAPSAAAVAALRAAIVGREVAEVAGRAAYFVYPDGVGRSRLTIALIEKKLGVSGTGRNWNTVLKLAEAVG